MAMPLPDPRTLDERLEYIRVLTEQLLRARAMSSEVKRISALLRQELDAAQTIVSKGPISDQ